MFVTTRRKHKEYEKSFQTPPTWECTVDVAHDKLFTARPVVAPVAAPICEQVPDVATGGGHDAAAAATAVCDDVSATDAGILWRPYVLSAARVCATTPVW